MGFLWSSPHGTAACRDAHPKSPLGALTIVNFRSAKLIAVMAARAANREPARMAAVA
jgi:hypothetical protein